MKADRVQAKTASSPLPTSELKALLGQTPGWRAIDDRLVLLAVLPTIRASQLFSSLVLEIGEANGFVPQVRIDHLEVEVWVQTSTGGLTGLDFEIASWFPVPGPFPQEPNPVDRVG